MLQEGADPHALLEGGKSSFDHPDTPLNWIVRQGNINGFDIIETHMLKQELSLNYPTLLDIAQTSDIQKNEKLISQIQAKV